MYNLDAGTAVLCSIYKHMRQDVKLYCNFDNMGDKWSEANFNNILVISLVACCIYQMQVGQVKVRGYHTKTKLTLILTVTLTPN